MLHAYSLTIKILEEDKKTKKIYPELKTFIAKEHTDMKKVLGELEYKI